MRYTPLIPVLGMQVDLCEFQNSLVYIVPNHCYMVRVLSQNKTTHIHKQIKRQQNKPKPKRNPQQPVITLGDTSQPLCTGKVASAQDCKQMAIPDLKCPCSQRLKYRFSKDTSGTLTASVLFYRYHTLQSTWAHPVSVL